MPRQLPCLAWRPGLELAVLLLCLVECTMLQQHKSELAAHMQLARGALAQEELLLLRLLEREEVAMRWTFAACVKI